MFSLDSHVTVTCHMSHVSPSHLSVVSKIVTKVRPQQSFLTASPPKDVECQGSSCSRTAAHPTAVTVSLSYSAGTEGGVGALANLHQSAIAVGHRGGATA